MKQIVFYTVLIMLFMITLCGVGQEVDNVQEAEAQWLENILLQQNQAVNSQDGILSNQAFIQQAGIDHSANVFQTNTGNDPNLMIVSQCGIQQNAFFEQIGSGNMGFSLQTGEGNTIDSYLEGDNNYMAIYQSGHENRLQQELIGNNSSYFIMQHGINNQIIQTENDGSGRDYMIFQVGFDMNLIITNGNIYP